MLQVCIVILNYHSGKDILECLESLKSISYPHYSILVVDNASTDDSYKEIKKYLKHNPSLNARSYKLKANYGYAGGNNRAIAHALKEGADYILILNPDTIVYSAFLEELMRVAQSYEKEGRAAFFGPRILLRESGIRNQESGEKNRVYSNGGAINWSQTKGTLRDYAKSADEVKETQPFETDYVTGTCLLVSKETIKKIGLMREDYFLYYEDTDWAIRARKQGIAQIIVPSSTIWHKVSTTTKPGSYSYIYYHTRNGLYCGWDNRNNLAQTLAVLAISKWIFLKQLIKWFIPSKRHWATPIMRGVIDFWKGTRGKLQ